MYCKECGQEVTKGAVICPSCGCKIRKPLYKKWWFWVIIGIVVLAIGGSVGSENENGTDNPSQAQAGASATQSKAKASTEEASYEKIDLNVMLDDLENNALKAEKTYQDKKIEITGKIANFDSDGSYITIEPVDGEFTWTTVMCYIKNKAQEEFLLSKSKGDTVTIKGKIKSIGEVLGYSIDIAEVQ